MAEVLAGDEDVCGLDSTCLGSLLLSLNGLWLSPWFSVLRNSCEHWLLLQDADR